MSVQSNDSAPVEVGPDYAAPAIGPEHLPQHVLHQPQGVSYPPLPPVVEGGEPEACGMVSGRWHTALPPSKFAADTPLNTTYKAVTAINSNSGDPVGDGRCTLEVAEWMMTNEEVAHMRRGGRAQIACHHRILGSIKGVVKTARDVELYLERTDRVMEVVDDLYGGNPSKIVLEPVFAGAFSTSMDEGTVKARRSISSVFADATQNLTEISTVCRHGRDLIDGGVDSSRFMMRLATLVVETMFAQAEHGDKVTLDVVEPAPIATMTTWTEFRRALAEDAMNPGINYVCWHALNGLAPTHEAAYVQILHIAAAADVSVQLDELKPVMIWPEIPNCVLLTSVNIRADEHDRASRFSVYPWEVYTAARMWVLRYGQEELFEQYLQYVSNLYWARVGDETALMTPFAAPTVRMPPAAMRGLLMAPFIQTPDAQAKLLTQVPVIEPNRMMAESVATTLVVAYAATAVRWHMVDYAIVQQAIDDRDLDLRLNVFREVNGEVSFWMTVQQFITQLGYKGKIGRLLGSTFSRQRFEQYKPLSTSANARLQSSDVISFLPLLQKGCSVQGWHQPEPIDAAYAIASQSYLVGELPKDKTTVWLSSLLEVQGIQWKCTKQVRNTRDTFTTLVHPPTRMPNGFAIDWPMLTITDVNGDRIRWGYELANHCVLTAHEKQHDRFNLTWTWFRVTDRAPTSQQIYSGNLNGVFPDPPATNIGFQPYQSMIRRRHHGRMRPMAGNQAMLDYHRTGRGGGYQRRPLPVNRVIRAQVEAPVVQGVHVNRPAWLLRQLESLQKIEAVNVGVAGLLRHAAAAAQTRPASGTPVASTSAQTCPPQTMPRKTQQEWEDFWGWLYDEGDWCPDSQRAFDPNREFTNPEELAKWLTDGYFVVSVDYWSRFIEGAEAHFTGDWPLLAPAPHMELRPKANGYYRNYYNDFDGKWPIFADWEGIMVPAWDIIIWGQKTQSFDSRGNAPGVFEPVFKGARESAELNLSHIKPSVREFGLEPGVHGTMRTVMRDGCLCEMWVLHEELAREIVSLTDQARFRRYRIKGMLPVDKQLVLVQAGRFWRIIGLTATEAAVWHNAVDAQVLRAAQQAIIMLGPEWFRELNNAVIEYFQDPITTRGTTTQPDQGATSGEEGCTSASGMASGLEGSQKSTETGRTVASPPPAVPPSQPPMETAPLIQGPVTRSALKEALGAALAMPETAGEALTSTASLEMAPPTELPKKGRKSRSGSRSDGGKKSVGKIAEPETIVQYAITQGNQPNPVALLLQKYIDLGVDDAVGTLNNRMEPTYELGNGNSTIPAAVKEIGEFKIELKYLGIGERNWKAVAEKVIEYLETNVVEWEERNDLYNCLDACQQNMRLIRGWQPDDEADSPICPAQVERREAQKKFDCELPKSRLNELRDLASQAGSAVKWPMPAYTDEQVEIIKAGINKLAENIRTVGFNSVRAVQANPRMSKLPLTEQICCILEIVAIERQYMVVLNQQALAVAAASNICREDGTLHAIIETVQQLGTLAGRSRCLDIPILEGINRRIKAIEWEKWAKALMVGGCPALLQATYGGRWPRTNNSSSGKCSDFSHGLVAMRLWMKTLSTQQRARFLMLCHPAALGPEHYSDLFHEINVQLTAGGVRETSEQREVRLQRMSIFEELVKTHDTSGDGWAELVGKYCSQVWGNETNRLSDMPRRQAKGGMPITYTCEMLNAAYPKAMALGELLHNKSPESDESEVSATAIGILSLPHRIAQAILCSSIIDTPLKLWWREYSQAFSRIRRSLCLGELQFEEQLLSLRKILNVTIRSSEDALLTTEDWNRGMVITRKHVFGKAAVGLPGSAYTKYEMLFAQHAASVVNDALAAQKEDIKYKTANNHWSERAIRGASGSSKMIKKYAVNADVSAFKDADRPGKKVLVEYLDDAALDALLLWEPQQRAYYFVKPEPGHKQRALYATYDEESFISAYANASIENTMGRTKGVFVRQTPADVLEWMSMAEGGLAGPEAHGAYWVSTDYSDYNSEHTLWEIAALDNACGDWYERNPMRNTMHEAGAIQKEAAHRWSAAGRVRSMIRFIGSEAKFEEQQRNYLPVDLKSVKDGKSQARILHVVNGMFSGSRTTARDNTWIHAIDMAIAKDTMAALGIRDGIKWFAICGDDEDAAFDNIGTAAAYLIAVQGVNHALNPIKQMGGAYNHEFLQFVSGRKNRIEKSAFTLLATLSTGNWYVQRGVWIQSAISAVFANYWELYCRGFPLQVCRRLAACTLERLMCVHGEVEEGVKIEKKLEWWNFRFSKGLPPLFCWSVDDKATEQPKFEAIVEREENWPSKATQTYVRTNKALLEWLPSRARKEMEECALSNTIGAAAKVLQQQMARRWAFKYWPERSSSMEEVLECNADWRRNARDDVDMMVFRYGIPRKNEMLTEEDIAGRMGVPFFLARRLGGAAKLAKYVTPEQWAKYSDITDQFHPINANGFELQTNLRAALAWSTTPIKPYHGNSKKLKPDNMLYVYMGNGAGKSHLNKVCKIAQDLDAVWMDAHGSIRMRADAAWSKSCFEPFSRVTQELLSVARERSAVLLGQLEPELVVEAAKKIKIRLDLAYFDPGESLRRTRLSSRNDWDSRRVENRIRRSNEGYAAMMRLGALELNSAGETLEYVKAYQASTNARLEQVDHDSQKVPAKFVFNYSGPLSRKLEIDAE